MFLPCFIHYEQQRKIISLCLQKPRIHTITVLSSVPVKGQVLSPEDVIDREQPVPGAVLRTSEKRKHLDGSHVATRHVFPWKGGLTPLSQEAGVSGSLGRQTCLRSDKCAPALLILVVYDLILRIFWMNYYHAFSLYFVSFARVYFLRAHWRPRPLEEVSLVLLLSVSLIFILLLSVHWLQVIICQIKAF